MNSPTLIGLRWFSPHSRQIYSEKGKITSKSRCPKKYSRLHHIIPWLSFFKFFFGLIANEAFANVAGRGLQLNMIIYLTMDYHMGKANAASFLFLWGAVGNFLVLPAAFITDSYLGRFRVIGIGSIISLIVRFFFFFWALL